MLQPKMLQDQEQVRKSRSMSTAMLEELANLRDKGRATVEAEAIPKIGETREEILIAISAVMMRRKNPKMKMATSQTLTFSSHRH